MTETTHRSSCCLPAAAWTHQQLLQHSLLEPTLTHVRLQRTAQQSCAGCMHALQACRFMTRTGLSAYSETIVRYGMHLVEDVQHFL